MSIDLYCTNKDKTIKLWRKAKALLQKDKEKLKQVKKKEDWVNKTTQTFEDEYDLNNLKEKTKEEKELDFNDADQLEEMLGEYREAALVINHENRLKQGGNTEKNRYRSGRELSKKNGDNLPKSLLMVDKESLRYQEEKQKKIQSSMAQETGYIENRSCTRWVIF